VLIISCKNKCLKARGLLFSLRPNLVEELGDPQAKSNATSLGRKQSMKYFFLYIAFSFVPQPDIEGSILQPLRFKISIYAMASKYS